MATPTKYTAYDTGNRPSRFGPAAYANTTTSAITHSRTTTLPPTMYSQTASNKKAISSSYMIAYTAQASSDGRKRLSDARKQDLVSLLRESTPETRPKLLRPCEVSKKWDNSRAVWPNQDLDESSTSKRREMTLEASDRVARAADFREPRRAPSPPRDSPAIADLDADKMSNGRSDRSPARRGMEQPTLWPSFSKSRTDLSLDSLTSIASKPKQLLKDGIKHTRPGQYFAKLAIEHDVADIPRLQQDAVLMAPPDDEKHSRMSYIEMANLSWDHARRELARGERPTFGSGESSREAMRATTPMMDSPDDFEHFRQEEIRRHQVGDSRKLQSNISHSSKHDSPALPNRASTHLARELVYRPDDRQAQSHEPRIDDKPLPSLPNIIEISDTDSQYQSSPVKSTRVLRRRDNSRPALLPLLKLGGICTAPARIEDVPSSLVAGLPRPQAVDDMDIGAHWKCVHRTGSGVQLSSLADKPSEGTWLVHVVPHSPAKPGESVEAQEKKQRKSRRTTQVGSTSGKVDADFLDMLMKSGALEGASEQAKNSNSQSSDKPAANKPFTIHPNANTFEPKEETVHQSRITRLRVSAETFHPVGEALQQNRPTQLRPDALTFHPVKPDADSPNEPHVVIGSGGNNYQPPRSVNSFRRRARRAEGEPRPHRFGDSNTAADGQVSRRYKKREKKWADVEDW